MRRWALERVDGRGYTGTPPQTRENVMALNKELLEILACPKCKGELVLLDKEDGLYCAPCGVVYPVKDEIPIMLVEEALKASEWSGSPIPHK